MYQAIHVLQEPQTPLGRTRLSVIINSYCSYLRITDTDLPLCTSLSVCQTLIMTVFLWRVAKFSSFIQQFCRLERCHSNSEVNTAKETLSDTNRFIIRTK